MEQPHFAVVRSRNNLSVVGIPEGCEAAYSQNANAFEFLEKALVIYRQIGEIPSGKQGESLSERKGKRKDSQLSFCYTVEVPPQ
jgi:hypothetical protein